MNLNLLARDGIFSTSEAARHGLDQHALRRLAAQQSCVRLTRGWFAVVGDTAPSREQLHALTARALGRQFSHRAAVSHYSRLILAELPTFRPDLDVVHLTSVVDMVRLEPDGTLSPRSPSVRRRGVVIHRPIGLRIPREDTPRPLTSWCLPVAYSVVQAGLLGGPEAFLVPADAATRNGLVAAEQLGEAVDRLAGHTGIGPVRASLALVDGRRESPGESRTAYLLAGLGYDLEPQFEVAAGGHRFRADFRIKRTKVLVEFDGAVKYADGDRRTLFDEKRREDALRRAGWVVVRVVWADLSRPDVVRRRIADAVALAA
ncbi:MAG: hypothetical protein L0H79_10390 [Intrasporangium sp.]|uniref:hypothetical protein n=1 Tax=Intrasporangium sp. TaxID=1925024 RepID=UPI002649AA74|nr:hypothetical protein [Intrasporangium sp.]MDN5796143.1 hypothetical protein [Intrasporangium sp.]